MAEDAIPFKTVRHLGLLLVTPAAVAWLCAADTKYEVSDFGLPRGARVVGCGWDGQRGCFAITVEHESFPEVQEGGLIPPLPQPVFRQVQSL